MYNGKRTEKWHIPKQLRMDQELGKKIRDLAEENCRSLEHEVLYIIKLGLIEAEKIDALIAKHRGAA